MRLAFAAMEDTGYRTGPHGLGRLCAAFGTDKEGRPRASTDPVDIMTTADEIRSIDAETLAAIDAVFVDFDLQSHKVPGNLRWQPLKLRNGVDVPPVTGMSALLWLRDVMESDQYRRLRGQYLAEQSPEHRKWVGPTGRTRLFAFVDAKDAPSQLYAAAAYAWFGAAYLNAQIDFANPEELRDATSQLQGDPDEYLRSNRLARWYAEQGGPMLDRLLVGGRVQNMERLIPASTPWPTNFDLYRAYRKHYGKSGFGTYDDPHGFREAFLQITGHVIAPQKRLLGDPTKEFFRGLQNSLDEFRCAADPNARDWSEWRMTGADPLYDYLTESARFWDAEDVRVAFEEHLRRGRLR
ncbi:hypothetical protein [Kribbella speibonae]|uniref:Uncharacterized protein n=1 Tax=Kribbella speibonae TaxID=1572660 RepID=A0A4R0J1I0_9ACTN|nr:hypothetical protein [Kribbella speibonae]TCC38894.1 hypothetical protein E0H92_21245 [Kribbella speibonae]